MVGSSKPEARPRFRLLHLMALVAATALTIALAPAFMVAVMRSYGPASSWNRMMYLSGATTLALTSWSMLLGPLELAANRSRLREAARSYGTSAVFASASALGFLCASRVVDTMISWKFVGWPVEFRSSGPWLLMLGGMLEEILRVAAASIVAAWSILALTREGRRPSGWSEILGLILGLCWVAWCLGRSSLFVMNPGWLQGDVPSWA